MFLFLAAALFVTYAVNVSLGAFGSTPFLGDVGEMLVLLSASIAFVVGILGREAAENKLNKNDE